jgi:hypothetical protein
MAAVKRFEGVKTPLTCCTAGIKSVSYVSPPLLEMAIMERSLREFTLFLSSSDYSGYNLATV